MKCRYSKEELEKAIIGSRCIKDVLVKLGLKINNRGYRIIHYYAKCHNLELPRLTGKESTRKAILACKIPSEQYFAKNTFHSGSAIRKRLFKEYKIKEECAICGIQAEWNGKFLRLQVDHIDGDHLNNLISNLRLLCPNCHSQTETFSNKGKAKARYSYCKCGRRMGKSSKMCLYCSNHSPKRKRINWPTDKEILELVWNNSLLQVGRILGVSDNAVRKHLKRQGFPVPKRKKNKRVSSGE
jgi:Zn finger protein HypA/HybF involved in hydrogenase expression